MIFYIILFAMAAIDLRQPYIEAYFAMMMQLPATDPELHQMMTECTNCSVEFGVNYIKFNGVPNKFIVKVLKTTGYRYFVIEGKCSVLPVYCDVLECSIGQHASNSYTVFNRKGEMVNRFTLTNGQIEFDVPPDDKLKESIEVYTQQHLV